MRQIIFTPDEIWTLYNALEQLENQDQLTRKARELYNLLETIVYEEENIK